jgi:hypothetical protein
MTTQTAERKELHQVIDALPDHSVMAMLEFVKSLRPNVEAALTGIEATRAAIAEIRAGRGKRFDSIDALMADLHNDED